MTEDATGLVYESTTGAGGEYIRVALKPGTYRIEVSATGFKKGIRRNLLLTAGDRSAADIKLEVGEVSTTVEVSSQAPVLQSESAIVGASVDSKQVSQLPLGGQRNFAFLARLSPGVVPNEPGARDAVGGGFSANGVRSNGQNNFLLNGVDNNVNVIDFLNQTSFVVGPSVEAIGEMRVMTNGYNAEYGRGAGGVVNVTLRNGTNQIHGALFEYLQNNRLNANRWERNFAGAARGPLKQNQFGVAVGGPAIKNRTFWFANYQGTRVRSTGGTVPGLGTSDFFTIPTPAMKTGDFSQLLGAAIPGTSAAEGMIFDPLSQVGTGTTATRTPFSGNIIPAARMDAAARKIIDLFPSPTRLINGGRGFQQNNYFVTTSGQQAINQGDLRLDHRISDKDSIFGSLSWSNLDQLNGAPLPGALDATYFASNAAVTLARNAMMSYTRVWSPSVVTETRAAFTRLVTSRTQANPEVDQFKAFGIGGYNPTGPLNGGLPSTTIDRYSGFGASDWLPSKEYNNVWDFIQNVAINKNGHSFKFGGEFRPIKFPFFQFPSPHGNWNFNRRETSIPSSTGADNLTGDGYASWLLGRVTGGQMSTTNFISSEKQAWAFYAQDDWKITSKLTINYGLRYELFSPIGERFGRQSNLDFQNLTLVIPKGKDQDAPLPPNFGTSFSMLKVSRGEVSKYLIPWDKTNLAPRIGFAYSVNNKTVVRAGYGIFYGGEENQGGNPNRGEQVPFNQTVQVNRTGSLTAFDANPFFPTAGGVTAGFPANIFSGLPANISFRQLVNNFRNPLVHKWNASIQREFGNGQAFELAYVGNRQARQLHFYDPNACPNSSIANNPCDPRRPVPGLFGINGTATFGFGNYAGLTAKYEKRYSSGLQSLISYTWGHALATSGTTLSGSAGFGVLDPRNWSTSYSSAAWDIRHSLVASFLYDLPFGTGKQFMNSSKAMNAVLGGWQMNGIVTLRTGNPATFSTNQCVGSYSKCLPDVTGKVGAPSGGRSAAAWFDTSAVKAPAPNTQGNAGLQSLNIPGQKNMDISLFKAVNLSERFKVQFRAEGFNLTNTVQLGTPNLTQGDPNFGRILSSQPGTERKFQMALRFMF